MKDTFANRLAEALKNKGWRQVDLSVATGISKSRISQYLKGNYEAKEETLKIIAEALNVNEVWLMGYDIESDPIKELNNQSKERKSTSSSKNEENEFRTLAAHISEELGLSEEMAEKVIKIARTLKD